MTGLQFFFKKRLYFFVFKLTPIVVSNVPCKSLVSSSIKRIETRLSIFLKDWRLEIKLCSALPRPENNKAQFPHSKFDNSITTIQRWPNIF